MESFSELIKARRSMRKFTEEELTQEQVVTLMKAALMAPTSKRSNAWQFIVVDEKDKLKELSYCKEQASQFYCRCGTGSSGCCRPAGKRRVDRRCLHCFHLPATSGRRYGAGKLLGAGARTFYGFRYAFRRVCARGVGYSFTAAGA